MTKKPKVVYILGYGHSGSTLIDIILGNHERITGVGELVRFNPMSQEGTSRCSCGLLQNHCSFWRQVTEIFREEAPEAKESTLPFLNERFDHWRSISCWSRIIMNRFKPSKEYLTYLSYITILFKAISQVSQRMVIVDSSKSPCRAAILAAMPTSIDLRIIHLVRDGRGACWSMIKKKGRTSKGPLSEKSVLIEFLKGIFGWIGINVEAELIARVMGKGRYIRVRYEDLFKDYERFFIRVGELIDESPAQLIQMISLQSKLRVSHLIEGNRVRKQKDIVLTPDVLWRSELPGKYKRGFRVLGGWMLKRYGYLSDE